MQPNDPVTPPPILDSRVVQLPERPKSLFELVALHFVAGLGVTTIILIAVVCEFRIRHADSFLLLASCGGIPIIVIQGGLLAIGAACRRFFSKGLLEERRPALTVACGILGGVLAFGIPIVVGHFVTGDIVDAVVVFIPLCIYPLIASAFVFRIAPQVVLEWPEAPPLQVAPVQYSGPILKAIPVKPSGITRLGRGIAMLAWALPVLSFATLMALQHEPSKSFRTTYLVLISIGAVCGLVALLGIPKWGRRRVFLPAFLGMAFCFFLLGMYYISLLEID